MKQALSSYHQAPFMKNVYDGLRNLLLSKASSIGIILVGLLLLTALMADIISPHSPYEQNLRGVLQAPCFNHFFGTDELGRDVFSRIIHGSRLTLLIILIVSIISTPIGLFVGLFSGYFRGWLDTTLMRVTDIFLSFPRLIFALALVVALGPGIENAMVAIGLTTWPSYARLVRSETIKILNSTYIKAVKTLGASHKRILFIHILPMCLPSLLVRVSLEMSGMILSAAGLGFLGLGAQPPLPEWGSMLASGREYMLNQWWLITFPGLSIFVISIGFNLLGDGLRDFVDPRQKL